MGELGAAGAGGEPGGLDGAQQGLGIWDRDEAGSIGGPVNAIDNDRGIRSYLERKQPA